MSQSLHKLRVLYQEKHPAGNPTPPDAWLSHVQLSQAAYPAGYQAGFQEGYQACSHAGSQDPAGSVVE